ncbi:MAG: methylmalonyl-CoA epimerase [Chloroflexi bacterium]|nr:MAG: methylmalonyl-CoA epimerase [Chloroflexota bacterium]
MPKITRIDHIAIVSNDIDSALHFWRDALGMEVAHIDDVPAEKSIVAFLPAGDSELEIVKPTTSDSGIAKYLDKRGPGMHHICLEVDDLPGMLAQLKEKGVQLINESPLMGSGGKQYAFIHPKSTSGVLVELYQITQ